jgi:hypothetical protein
MAGNSFRSTSNEALRLWRKGVEKTSLRGD